MTQQLVLPQNERERRAEVVNRLSIGWIIASAIGGIIVFIAWLFIPSIPVVPSVAIAGGVVIMSLITYLICRMGSSLAAGYFFIICITLLAAVVTLLFGGFTGPLAIIYFLPILVTGMTIGIRASFVTATLVTIIYLAMAAVERAGIFSQLIVTEATGDVLPYLTVIVYVIFFYLVAFLSWFAASRLNRALQNVRQYAGELQTANEKLQASEEELRASNEELEAANEELRSSNEEMEAANEELREAQEQLVRSEKLAVIGQLAGGVGHELRNPLGAIKNAVYYIKGKVAKSELAQKEPRVAEFLDIMDDEINSSNKIINDLLGFSRVGKPAVSPAMIEMVIDDAIAHTQMPESIELTKKLDTSLPEVEIDTDQVRQVLVNIITNAVQAMPEGGKLTIGARTVDNFLQVEITDTGVGIPEDAIEKVFDPLFTMKAKGIGLGLAVCQSIIERHEGHIGVASKMGKGTTFTVRLPLKAG